MENVNVAMICKLMPYYRLGIFKELSQVKKKYKFTFFGDIKTQNGIKQIPFSYANTKNGIRWVKTKNYFYKPERLLWQTKIIQKILFSDFQIFVFEGAIAHYPIWFFASLCKLKGKKVIFWTHGNRGLDKGIKKLLRRIMFEGLGNMLFLYGNKQRDLMIKDGYDPDRLRVIYNSLQPDEQFEILSKINSITNVKSLYFDYPDNFTLIFIGRLTKGKKVMNVLRILKRFIEDDFVINCIFIGEGSEQNKMNNYIKRNDLQPYVYSAGAFYSEEEIAPFFKMSDIMISPGNVGLNCIHSLAYGVPVATHNDFKFQNPEVEAIIDGSTGLFFERNNLDDLYLKLKSWINKGINKKDLQINCQNVIKRVYNPKNQVNKIMEGLDKLSYEK